MTRRTSHRGFVLLVVLAAAALLSIIAALVYSRTENQLMLSVSARGQSLASARATNAAERTLALLRGFRTTGSAPAGLSTLGPMTSYEEAITNGQVLSFGSANYDLPALDISNGNGAQWCVDLWVLNRGPNINPWLVVEAQGFYGTTNPKPNVGETGFVAPGCTPKGNPRIVSSRITVHLEWPNLTSGGGTGQTVDTTGAGPAGGSGAVGAF